MWGKCSSGKVFVCREPSTYDESPKDGGEGIETAKSGPCQVHASAQCTHKVPVICQHPTRATSDESATTGLKLKLSVLQIR